MKSVVLLSGGLDSTTLLYQSTSDSDRVVGVGFDYGQRHSRELSAAAMLAHGIGVRFITVDLRSVGEQLIGSALSDRSVEVPDGHYAEDTMKATIVPNRNAMMLNCAAAIAISYGADEVRAGMHAGDHPIYPDCRPEFVESLNATLEIGTESGVKVVAPFIHMTKGDIVRRGTELHVPYELTWSCYKGGADHCGRCGTCIERREAFIEAGVHDPTTYEDESLYAELKADGRVL